MSSDGTQTSQTQSIPGWLSSAGQQYLGQAGQIASTPYTPYTGQRVSGLTPLQQSSIQGLGDLAGGGTSSFNAANDMLTSTLQGQYGSPYGGGNAVSGGGQYSFDPVSGGSNQYMGENPYFRQSLQTGLGDIADAYRQGTSADTTRMFNLGGAFGGSAHQNAVANNEKALADRMGQFTNQMYQGQFDRSAQLAESGLNRNLGASQFNANLGSSSFENAANRNLNASQFGAGLGSSAYENERNRQMAAAGGAANLYGAQGSALTNALNAGGLEQKNYQDLLNSQYQDFNNWNGWGEHQLGVFGNALSSLLGRSGGTTTTQGPGSDPFAQGLGAWSLANSFGGSSK